MFFICSILYLLLKSIIIVKLLALALTDLVLGWSTWSPTWPNLALDDLVTNLTKLPLKLDKSGPVLTL